MHYYNEIDPGAAAWLRNLITAGLIPNGEVDQRSIVDVQAKDLKGFESCHFFAGVGGWPFALRLAGWLDERPVWTGSAPCQSYSVAGKQKGDDDPRNLWPHFFRLIRERRPDFVFGEQVANAIRHGWLDGISADLEGAGYAVGATVLGAHSVNAPHRRQRLYWVAESSRAERGGWGEPTREHGGAFHVTNGSGIDEMEYAGRSLRGPGLAARCSDDERDRNATGRTEVAIKTPSASRVDRLDNAECPDARLRDGQERTGEVGRDRLAITSTTSGVAKSDGRKPRNRRIQPSGQHGCNATDNSAGRGAGCEVGNSETGRLGIPAVNGHQRSRRSETREPDGQSTLRRRLADNGNGGDTSSEGLPLPERQELRGAGRSDEGRDTEQPGGPWGSYYVAHCRDGKARRVGTGIQPLAYGVPRSMGQLHARLESLGIDSEHVAPKMLAKLLASARRNRVTRLRGYGNAIVPAVAAEFVSAFLEINE